MPGSAAFRQLQAIAGQRAAAVCRVRGRYRARRDDAVVRRTRRCAGRAGRPRMVADRHRHHRRIAAVGPANQRQRQRQVVDVSAPSARSGSGSRSRRRQGHDMPGARGASGGRLDAGDAAEVRRFANAAAGIRTELERGAAAGDDRRRAAAAAAGAALGIEGIAAYGRKSGYWFLRSASVPAYWSCPAAPRRRRAGAPPPAHPFRGR